jgi:ABC-type multidrug transport system fused ATPase/permease subunit
MDGDTENAPVGNIKIDGIRIDQLGLHQLRKNMTVIPQDPLMLAGTIRFNVDPISLFTDQEIIHALKKSQVWETISILGNGSGADQSSINTPLVKTKDSTIKNGEEMTIEEIELARLNLILEDGGSNLSIGQRQ